MLDDENAVEFYNQLDLRLLAEHPKRFVIEDCAERLEARINARKKPSSV